MLIGHESATIYARWFKSLADPTRVLLLNRLAHASEPLSVGELVAEVDVNQSTVSHHLKVLADVGFVLVQKRGNQSLYRVNDLCMASFPSAAQVVMGATPLGSASMPMHPPWMPAASKTGEVAEA